MHSDLQNDFDALVPGRSTAAGASRRTALGVLLGAGYAAAAAPVCRATVAPTVPMPNAWSSQYACGVLAIVVNSGLGGLAFFAARMAPEIGST